MKRLAYFIRTLDKNTTTYPSIYEGRLLVQPLEDVEPYPDDEAIYYHEKVGYEITVSNKLKKDRPTVTAMIPAELLGINDGIMNCSAAAADHCLRRFIPYIDRLNRELYNRARPDEENGKYFLPAPQGEVLVRNCAYFAIKPQKWYENGSGVNVHVLGYGRAEAPKLCLCIKLQVQLPRNKIKRAGTMLCQDLPLAVADFIQEFDRTALSYVISLAKTQQEIRKYLKSSPYCAFIANGSVLPREKDSHLPMKDAIPFISDENGEIEICGIRGMGIKRGVTVITGGGYSGKSTLLDGISSGIYDHAMGDGRELCITDSSAVTVSSEDGRAVKSLNISPFIKWIPKGDPKAFSTSRASGSTSQAANIMEALEGGTELILIDEDKSATNFMIRDRMMKALIEKEPITPFTDRVRELYSDIGVSTVLVIGGSGEYLGVADRIYKMDNYRIFDVTENAKKIFSESAALSPAPSSAYWRQSRTLYHSGFSSYPEGMSTERLSVSKEGFIFIGDEAIDIRHIHDIVSEGQANALGYMLRYIMIRIKNDAKTVDIEALTEEMYREIKEKGLDTLFSPFFTATERFFDLPRKQELYSVVNRMRRTKLMASTKGCDACE